ncbi:MAG: polyprenyl synthetase family protein [Firmicutes bacterium]|jgi:geranylgeranyl diphosphate synthase type II|nr:polyprenyl synthetase family protein [Bacillota bacterium]
MKVKDLKQYSQSRAQLIEKALEEYLPGDDVVPEILHRSMRYSTLGGGKRLRGILALAAAEMAGGSRDTALPLAAALEMIHAFSLIHDDLPCMDDDDWRRGKPSNHKMFGEAIALLAGDALLTRAFYLLTRLALPGDVVVNIVAEVAQAVGSEGLIGGQVVDLQSEGKQVDRATLEYIHCHKTGDLIAVALRTGAMVGGAGEELLASLTAYGRELGLLFQITDDILDVEGDADKLGKPVGSDVSHGKATYPALFGMEKAKEAAQAAAANALAAVAGLGEEAWPLRELIDYILHRDR